MIKVRFILFLVVILSSCDSDEAEFPELLTLHAQQIGRNSAVLEMEIKETGSIRPVRYGFLWGESSGLNVFNASDKVDLGVTSQKAMYSILVETLSPGTTYFVRAFAADQDFSKVYYGNEVTFSTLN